MIWSPTYLIGIRRRAIRPPGGDKSGGRGKFRLDTRSLQECHSVPNLRQHRNSHAHVKRRPAGGFVQFNSGSTSTPKGVCLISQAIAANVEAMIDAVAGRPSDVVYSWLPLYHDMGLVGMLLTGLTAGSRSGPGRPAPGLVLSSPERFAGNPRLWLNECAAYGATVTAAPPSAYRVATLLPRRQRGLDLGRLRTCIVGAVTMQSAGQIWNSAWFDRDSIQSGKVVAADKSGLELVGNGPPLPGVDVRVHSEVDELRVASPSLMTGYTGNEPHRRQPQHHASRCGICPWPVAAYSTDKSRGSKKVSDNYFFRQLCGVTV